jgi:hypothetical protein
MFRRAMRCRSRFDRGGGIRKDAGSGATGRHGHGRGELLLVEASGVNRRQDAEVGLFYCEDRRSS